MPDEHPSIARFRAELAARGGTGEIVVLPDSVHTAALAAEALGCEVGAIAWLEQYELAARLVDRRGRVHTTAAWPDSRAA